MPEQAFAAEWEATSGRSLLKVKRIFRVSYKTVLYRPVQSGRETCRSGSLRRFRHLSKTRRAIADRC